MIGHLPPLPPDGLLYSRQFTLGFKIQAQVVKVDGEIEAKSLVKDVSPQVRINFSEDVILCADLNAFIPELYRTGLKVDAIGDLFDAKPAVDDETIDGVIDIEKGEKLGDRKVELIILVIRNDN